MATASKMMGDFQCKTFSKLSNIIMVELVFQHSKASFEYLLYVKSLFIQQGLFIIARFIFLRRFISSSIKLQSS